MIIGLFIGSSTPMSNSTARNNLVSFIFATIAIIGLTCWTAEANAADGDKLLNAGFSRLCGKEPVFNGTACIYQANKTAKKTVVLIHGINGEAANWYHQLLELKKHYHVLTFDLPGFGRSSQKNKLYSPTNYAKFVDFIIKKHAKGTVLLAGHSMGAAIALRYNFMFPDTVDRMILVDIAGILHRYAFTKSLAFKLLGIFEKISYIAGSGFQDIALTLLQSLEELPIDIKHALAIPELREIILRGNSSPIAGAALVSEDFSKSVFTNRTPTLIIWGEYDIVTPLRLGKLLRTNFKRAYLEVLPNAAHSSMVDQYQGFNKLMMRHFQSTPAQLEAKYWRSTKFIASQKIGECINDNNPVFEGAYKLIKLSNCSNVQIKNARIASIQASGSTLTIEDSVINTNGTGLVASKSDITMTNVVITAATAIESDKTKLDIAGTIFNTQTSIIKSNGGTTVVFSICKSGNNYIHEFVSLRKNKTFRTTNSVLPTIYKTI